MILVAPPPPPRHGILSYLTIDKITFRLKEIVKKDRKTLKEIMTNHKGTWMVKDGKD